MSPMGIFDELYSLLSSISCTFWGFRFFFSFFYFYLLFGCLTPNFGLLSRRHSHYLMLITVLAYFDSKIIRSLLTRSGPKFWLNNLLDFNSEPSNFECYALMNWATDDFHSYSHLNWLFCYQYELKFVLYRLVS